VNYSQHSETQQFKQNVGRHEQKRGTTNTTKIKSNKEANKEANMTDNNTAPKNFTNKEIEIQAAVFRRLLAHLDNHKEVQNIDLMITAGFCRNCFSKWTVSEAEKLGVELDIDTAREQIYGMPYSEWKANHQLPATDEQMAAFNAKHPK